MRQDAFNPLTPERLASLEKLVGQGALRADGDSLERYSHDETESFRFLPEAVVLPANAQEVSAVLAFASAHALPVTARGGGTGLSGGALPVRGGIVLSLERLCRIRTIDERNLTAEVEAGVTTGALQEEVEARGLFYPPDPSSKDSCQIGGNIAEDAAGPRSCKYGPTRRYILGLEAVLADGTLFRTGGANRKDATGYNLTQLLVGSEGTLAVVTAATLRLLPLPKARLTMALPFATLDRAAAAVEGIFRGGFEPAACEILERAALEAVEAVHPVPAQLAGREALLVLELDGDEPGRLLDQAAALAELARSLGSEEALVAQSEAEQRRLWEIRRKVGEAVKHRSVYKEADTVVPRSKLAELVRAARDIAGHHGIEAICYGHAADGNLHVNLLRGDLEQGRWEAARDAAEAELFAAAITLGGKTSGEHGIGWVQRQYLEKAVGKPALGLMRRIKQVFDPQGILNPGKVFPE